MTARRTCCLVLSACVLTLMMGRGVSAQSDCSQPFSDTVPSGARRITEDYQTGNPGWWWEIYNWEDGISSDGRLDPSDTYNFYDARLGTIECPGPSIMMLSDGGERWYYMAGTVGSTGNGDNVNIYRTKDFAHFELHMRAFSTNNINGVNQYTPGDGKAHMNNTWFTNISDPFLYFDPTHTAGASLRIYLSFSACKESTDGWNDSSVFLVQMEQSDFLEWHTISDPQNANRDGSRFADARDGLGFQQWYFYNATNYSGPPYIKDGGYSVQGLIPASGDPWALKGGAPGELEERGKGWSFRNVGAATFMERDSFVFFDPNLSNTDPWKRVMFYTWSDEHTSLPWIRWGNRVAAHPLLANNIQFDVNYDTIPIAFTLNAKSANKVLVDSVWKNNGSRNAKGYTRTDGGIAEGSAVVYLPETDRYYVFYCRNAWNNATYQIVYRMTAPGAPLSSIAMGWTDLYADEYILLRNVRTDQNGVPVGDGSGGWLHYEDNIVSGADEGYITNGYIPHLKGFGTPEVFSITSGSGSEYFYLATGVKLDYEPNGSGQQLSARRTVFFKELTVADPSTGVLKQLAFDPTDTIDPSQNILKFRIPYCREQ